MLALINGYAALDRMLERSTSFLDANLAECLWIYGEGRSYDGGDL